MKSGSVPSALRILTLATLVLGLVFYLPLHLAGMADALLTGAAGALAVILAAVFTVPLTLIIIFYMPLLVNPMAYLWMGVAMEGLVLVALLWGRTGRLSRLLLVLIAIAIPTGPWVFSYHPAVAPAPGYRMSVPTQPRPLEGIAKQAQRWMEVVPSKYILLGWDGEEAFYYREEPRGDSQRLWVFEPGRDGKPRQIAEIPSGLQMGGARVSVLDRVRAPGALRPEDEPSIRSVHVRGDGLESPNGRWAAVLSKWIYGPEDVVILWKE